MNIGEVFASLRIDGSKVKTDATKAGTEAGGAAGTAASKSFGDRFRKALSASEVQKGLLAGLGLAGGLGAANLVAKAIGTVTDALGDSVKAAREEQLSVAKLDAALEANVESWDGNTEAIEDALKARMDLGYADDEQRDSLAQLVAVTKDSTDALKLQRTAMDLARLRNMSLADASALLGKVYGGNVGILSRYGIQLKKGTTATEALGEIQKRAAGQAEAWADENRKAVADVRIADAMETIGLALLPVVDGLTEFAAEVIPVVITGLGNLGDAFNNINRFIDPSLAAVQDFEQAVREKAAAVGLDARATLAWVQAEERRAKAEQHRQEIGAELAEISDQIMEANWRQFEALQALNVETDDANIARQLENERLEVNKQHRIETAPLLEQAEALYRELGIAQAEEAAAADLTTDAERRAEEALKAYTAELERNEQIAGIVTGAWTGLGETAKDTGNDIYTGLVKPVKRAFVEAFQAMAEVQEPWKEQWREIAAWAKDPFSEKKFDEYISGRVKRAMKNARHSFGAERKRWLEISRAYRWIAKQEWIDPMTADLEAIMEGLRVASRMTKGAANSVIQGTDWQLPGNNASGTQSWRGGWSWVGERGPELMRLPAGTAIKSSEQSMAMAGTMSGRIEVVVRDPDGGLARSGISTSGLASELGAVLSAARSTAGTRYTDPRRYGGG